MRVSIGWVLVLAFGAVSPGWAQEERFSVMVGETRVGHLVARTEGPRTQIAYDYKNNGRGPTLAESIEIGAAGLPLAWAGKSRLAGRRRRRRITH